MPLIFKDTRTEFTARDLKIPTLNFLVPDDHLYEVLAIQPTGTLTAEAGFIGHADRESAQRRFQDFLGLAVSKNCDLALAPEYSCPWDVLITFLAGANLPQARKMWIIGCEGIAPDELRAMIAKCPDVEWIHEPFPTGVGSLYGVLAYVTVSETTAGQSKPVVVLQFKTHAMGGDPVERDLLIPGHAIYIWQNPDHYIRLISIICADAMAFTQTMREECRCDIEPTLIFHPQLTGDPHHAAMCDYRGHLFLQEAEKLEVISLNWARGFVIPGRPANPYGGSAIYTKAVKFDTSDARVNANHRLGLYFTHWETHRTKLCFFNFDEHLFHLRMPKVAHRGFAVHAQRTGPEMLGLWKWGNHENAWVQLPDAVDGFPELCAGYDDGTGNYFLDGAYSHLDRERLLALSAGGLKPRKDWYKVERLPSFTSERDERCKRLTFTHEQVDLSKSFRERHLGRYSKLQKAIIPNATFFPANIQDMRGDCELRPPIEAEEFRCNLRSATEALAPATGIFLSVCAEADARQMFDSVVREWGREKTRRLVVWFERPNGQIAPVSARLPTISDDTESPGSISLGGEL